MPASYLRCTAEAGSCPLMEHCLRSKIHREATYEGAERYGLEVVNLWNKDVKACSADCHAYRSVEKRRFAQGFTHLFDVVPKGVYATVRREVEGVFGSRRTFFYCKGGDQLTSPEEQKRIARIFQRHGITVAPQYDGFVDVYDWS